MGIGGENAAIMLDQYQLAKAFDIRANKGHAAFCSSANRRALACGDIYTIIMNAAL